MATKKRRGERPDGLIQVSLQIGFQPDGKPLRRYFYGHSRAEAERKRDAFRASYFGGSRYDPDITLRDWISVFKSTYRKRVNPAYLSSDAAPYNRLSKALGHMRIKDIRESDLQKALNAVSGMSFSTADKYRQAIRRVFERAKKNKLIAENPADDLILPPNTKGTHRSLDRWEFDLILANWNTPASHAGLWVMLMLLCGLRRGEMMALDWKDVDLSARTLRVSQVAVVSVNQTTIEQRAKTDAGLRTLPICQALHSALSSVPPERRFGFVCLSAHNNPLTESAVSRGLKTFCAVLERIANNEPPTWRGKRPTPVKPDRKLFSFTAHDLRHTYATALYDAGVPVKAAQYFLGHADIRITLDLYTHLSRDRETASRNQMIEYLDNWIDRAQLSTVRFDPENEQ